MKSWPTKPLGEVLLTLETGSRPKGGVGEIPDGIPSVSGEHINREGQFYWNTPKHITRDFYARMKRGRIQRGDILVVKDGATTGKTATVRDNFPFSEAAINEHVFLLRTDKTKALPEFVGYFLFGPIGQQQILSNFRGAAIGGIAQDFVCNVHIPLPPLAEQERIVKLLDEADELRKLRVQADHRTAELIPALFHKTFGDPATNPKRWPVKSLRELSEKFSDGPFGSNLKTSHYTESGVRVIRLTNIGVGCMIDDNKAYVSPEHFEQLNKHKCLPGDVLVGTLGDPNLRAFILPPEIDMALNKSDCVQIRPKKGVAVGEFICWLLNLPSTLAMASGMILGQTRSRISMGRLAELRVPLPPLALQQEFAKRVTEIRELEASQATSRTRLDALFQSMLYRAFNGEL